MWFSFLYKLSFLRSAMITAIQQKKSYQWFYQWTGLTTIFGILTLFGPLFPLFCNALGMSKTKIGFLLSILPLSFLLSIFIARWIMHCGPKKIVTRFYFARYLIVLLLPLAVWIAKSFGDTSAFVWVALIILFFAVLRAIAETAWGPWLLELIPAKARGKVEAINAIVANISAAIASLGAVLILKNWPGILGYNVAIYVGIFFGFIGLTAAWRLPGGNPQIVEKRNWTLIGDTLEALRNPRFGTWIKGALFLTIGFAGFGFLPLYLNERIGFSADLIMLFSGCFQAGALLSAFFWGWSADRFGSKPVFMSALAGLSLVPVLLFLLPRLDQQSVVGTCFVYAFFGIVLQGWGAGANRYFYVTVLPTTRSPASCTALNASLQNVLAACCSFFYGWLLDALRSVKFDWHFIHFNNFTILFFLMLVCCLAAFRILRNALDDSSVRTGEFMSFFFEGNPLLAVSSMLRYHLAEDESQRMELTRRMGDAKSRLTVEEILQAADDPNFNMRYEAVVSMARMPPDNKLINALALAVRSREPGVSEAACWALGRMGDSRAIPVLREMLKCEYALLRSQCARALAKLNDMESVPEIIKAFKNEINDNIRTGYAAALGRLRRKEALPDIVALLRCLPDDRLRGDVALAVARIIGGEHHFVRLWKRGRADFETTCAEELLELETKAGTSAVITGECRRIIGECARHFEQRNKAAGAKEICAMINLLPKDNMDPLIAGLLRECDEQLRAHGGERDDYIILALTAARLAIVSLIHLERKKRLSS